MPLKVSLIGAGRLGRSLSALLEQAGVVTELLGRDDRLSGASDAVLLTVSDRAIVPLAETLDTHVPVLHCSGALDWRMLRPRQPIGWFHPLMTFPGPDVQLPDLNGVPVAVDGDPAALACAERITKALGAQAIHVPGDVRLYHCAAVLAGNFSTLLVQAAARSMAGAGVTEKEALAWLRPLMQASIDNAVRQPETALTGPAARGDQETIDAHRAALHEAGLTEVIDLYDHLTKHSKSFVTD